MLLGRLCRWAGIDVATQPLPASRATQPAQPGDLLQQLAAKGLPVQMGRPDDPMLDLLDLPAHITAHTTAH